MTLLLQEDPDPAPRFVSFCKLVARLTQSILVKTMRFGKIGKRDIEVHSLSKALKNQDFLDGSSRLWMGLGVKEEEDDKDDGGNNETPAAAGEITKEAVKNEAGGDAGKISSQSQVN